MMELQEDIAELIYSGEVAKFREAWEQLDEEMQERLFHLANWCWTNGIEEEEYWEDLTYTFQKEKLLKKMNQMTAIHPDVGYLKGLQRIAVYHNLLTELPVSLTTLPKLEYLDLYCNKIEKLPENIGDLKTLKRLDLYQNHLTAIPESIGDLENLEHLNLASNQITVLPKSIAKLQNLQKVYIPYQMRGTAEVAALKLLLPECKII